MRRQPMRRPGWVDYGAPVLYHADHGTPIRNATRAEVDRSRQSRRAGAVAGVIEAEGIRCYVVDWRETVAVPR